MRNFPSDVKTVYYFLANSATGLTGVNGTGLMRSEMNRASAVWTSETGDVDIFSQAAETLAEEVVGIRFRYFDGYEWLLEWDSEVAMGLPLAVEIELVLAGDDAQDQTALGSVYDMGLSGIDPELVYRTVVQLPNGQLPQATSAAQRLIVVRRGIDQRRLERSRRSVWRWCGRFYIGWKGRRTMRLVFAASRRAMVLPLVLIVIALLSLSAYTFSELMLTEYSAAVVNERQAQARYLADSGAEYLADFVSQLDDVQLQNGGRYHNPGFFQGNLVIDGELPRDRGRFSIVVPNIENGELAGIRYGVEDESTRVNLNTLLLADKIQPDGGRTLLMALPGMTEDLADAILDWIDPDDDPRKLGAEIEYYSTVGYSCKNGPLDTIEELLQVRGMTPELLFRRRPQSQRRDRRERDQQSIAFADDGGDH